ncbi:MAG TPA: branched-chain amino acid ABC transporter permease [Streptosporangiaceae bacterium]
MNSPQIPDQVFIGAANRLVPWVLRTTGRRHVALAVAGGVVLGIASILLDQYRDYQMAQVAAFVVAVAGLTVLIGLSGQISIGNGAFMAVGGYVAALLFMRLNWPLIAILIMSTLAAAAVGAVFGVAAARLRGPYLAGATLMLAVALPFFATRFSSLLGGDQGLGFFVTVPGFLGVNFSPLRWQAWVNCAAALIAMVLLANLVRSKIGRSWRAVRDDEVAAALAGINVARMQILAFIVSAACAGLGGVLLAVVVGTVSPSLFTLGLSIQLLTAAVLGGLGSLSGAIWGSILLVIVPTYLTNVATSHGLTQTTSSSIPILAYGIVLIVVMLLFPRGIAGGISRLIGPASQPDARFEGPATALASWRRRSPAADRKEKGRT